MCVHHSNERVFKCQCVKFIYVHMYVCAHACTLRAGIVLISHANIFPQEISHHLEEHMMEMWVRQRGLAEQDVMVS